MPNEDGATTGNEGNTNGAEVQMTQARFDAIILERVQQAKRAAIANAIADLGFESLEALKTFINQARSDSTKFETDRKTWETEKETLTNAGKSIADELSALKLKTEREEIDAAIRVEAAKPEYKIAGAAVASVPKLVNRALITREADGTLKGIDAAIKAVIVENPFLTNVTEAHGSPHRQQQRRASDDSGAPRIVRKM